MWFALGRSRIWVQIAGVVTSDWSDRPFMPEMPMCAYAVASDQPNALFSWLRRPFAAFDRVAVHVGTAAEVERHDGEYVDVRAERGVWVSESRPLGLNWELAGPQGRDDDWMALRLIYLAFAQLVQWAALMVRDSVAKDVELLVLRCEVAGAETLSVQVMLHVRTHEGRRPDGHAGGCRAV